MAQLDAIIHQPARLRIMALLTALEPGDEVDFSWLRDQLELTDGNLGAHLSKLEEVNYIKVHKRFVARKPKTYLAVTNKGRGAFEEHVAELQRILERAVPDDRTA